VLTAAELVEYAQQWQEAGGAEGPPPEPLSEESRADLLRWLLIGLLFESGRRCQTSLPLVGKAVGATTGLLWWGVRPILNSWPLTPVRRRLAHLSAQGELEVARLHDLGRREEAASRGLTQAVTEQALKTLIDYLATKPEVRTLIQQQGYSLASEVVDGVREQTVAADTLLERLLRSLLGRQARSDLPAAPVAVQAQATQPKRGAGLEDNSDAHE
jgi:hypothetical protein